MRAVLDGCPVGGGDGAATIDEGWGEPGLTSAEKIYGWNSLIVLAVISGRVAVEGSGGELLKAGPGDAVWLSAADPDVVVRAISSGAVFFRAMVPALQH